MKTSVALLRFLERFLLFELLNGLSLTGRYFFKKKTTLQYPQEQTPTSPRCRGPLLALRRYPNGEERCIACKLCEAVCPALAITIEAKASDDGARRTTRYDIDAFKCINCGFCEEACPVDAIVLTRETNIVYRERPENIFDKATLLAIGEHYEAQIAKDRAEDNQAVDAE